MVATDEILHKEHLLAEKARDILEHQQMLAELDHQKEDLLRQKPDTQKEQITYEESVELGKRVKKYEKKLHRIELQIQKVTRELNALKLQAKKLLPVSDVKVKVSMEGSPCRTFCIKHVKPENESQTEEHFKIEQL